jgi:hypothetical protein
VVPRDRGIYNPTVPFRTKTQPRIIIIIINKVSIVYTGLLAQ